MAKKMYYTQAEAAAELGVDEAQIQQFAQDGKLRAFQDGTRRMYKAEEVDALKAETGGATADDTGEIELAPADSVADAIDLSAADTSETPVKDDTVITAEGISIFEEDEAAGEGEVADPMAKTQIAPSLEDQISLEGSGTGSGLLDLTRESDDTSLGAEVLDQIDMDEVGASELETEELPEEEPAAYIPAEAAEAQAAPVAAPVATDASAGLFNGMIIASAILALLLAMVTLAAMNGVVPGYLNALSGNLLITIIACVVLAGIVAGVGWFVGRSAASRQQALSQAEQT